MAEEVKTAGKKATEAKGETPQKKTPTKRKLSKGQEPEWKREDAIIDGVVE